MITRVRALFERSQVLRYLLVGGLGYLFEMAILLFAVTAFSSGATAAVTASYWLGLVFSFFLQKVVAFGSRNRRASILGKQAFFYALLVLLNYGFTVFFAALTAPAVGVFLSRTIALIITTVWNYFLYRTIIFNEKIIGKSAKQNGSANRLLTWLGSRSGLLILIVVSASLATALTLMSLLANPVADDYAYYANLDSAASPLAYVIDHYLTHNGRLSQNSVVTIAFVFFGKSAIQIVPLLLFYALSAALAWVFWLLLDRASNRAPLAIALGLLTCSLALLATPSLVDSYLWLTSSTVYLGSLIGLVVSVGLALSLARTRKWPGWAIALSLLWMFLAQSFSEPTAILAIAGAGLWGVWELMTRNWRRLGLATMSFGALLAGFLVVLLSPGTISRRAEVDVPFSIRHIVFGPLDYFPQLFSGFQPWICALLLLAGLITARSLGKLASKKMFHVTTLTLAALVFLGSSYFVFAVSNYGSTYFPYRNFTLPVFGLVIAFSLVSLSGWKAALDAIPVVIGRQLTVPIASVLLIAAVPVGFFNISTHLQSLAVRDSMAAAREVQLSTQLASGASVFAVHAAPVLTRSEAVEIENPPADQVDWLVEGFRAWHGIPVDASIEPLPTTTGYCLPVSHLVKPEFVCR